MIEKNARFVALFCGIFFILGIFAAMFVYPGGYDFSGYYISTLGAVHAKNGAVNLQSRLFFLGAMVLGAFSLFFFWLISDNLLKELVPWEKLKQNSWEKIITLGSVVGLIATAFMILIAIFPMDTLSTLHSIVAITFFISSGFAIVIYSVGIVIQQLKDRKESNYYRFFSLMVVILASILVGLMVLEIISIREIVVIVVCALVVILSVILINRLLDQLIDYLSYVSSVFMLLLIGGILFLVLVVRIRINPQMEISFIWGMVIWNLIQILQVWDLVPEERKSLRKSPRAFINQVQQKF